MLNMIEDKDGNIFLINCGNKVYKEKFRIGDIVPFSIDPDIMFSACFADGVYKGMFEVDDVIDHWIVIKDHRVVEIFSQDDSGLGYKDQNDLRDVTYDYLIKAYDIVPEMTLYSRKCIDSWWPKIV